jgi:hypothetical protein
MVKVKLGDLTWGQIVGDNYQPSFINYIAFRIIIKIERKL